MFRGLIKNIFFDFDGVILDSVECKTQAFEEMYMPYGNDIAKQVKEYHLLNGGISRYEKFIYWHKKHLGKEINLKQLEELSADFSNRVVDQVVSSKEIDGSIEFIIKEYSNYRFWIITGTPTKEMRKIADRLKISKYFLGIYGSPKKKKYWVDYLIKEFKLIPKETLFLGDATTDYEAAKWGKIHFALREANYNKTLFKEVQVPRFKNFVDLKKILNEYI